MVSKGQPRVAADHACHACHVNDVIDIEDEAIWVVADIVVPQKYGKKRILHKRTES